MPAVPPGPAAPPAVENVVPVSTPPTPAAAPAPAAAPPPVGAKANVATEPVTVGSADVTFRPAAARPRVAVYDVITHRCLQEDTWESLSEKYMYSKRYAEALQDYNRKAEQASDRMRRDGRPVPGDNVYVPPVGLLLDKFGSLIRKE
jgi:hypothetical protein